MVGNRMAHRVESLPPYVLPDIARRIRDLSEAGRDIIRLDIGSPDMPPPDAVTEALCRSVRAPSHHGYGGFYGIPALRQAMAAYYKRRFGVDLDPEREVTALIGSKEGVANAAVAFVDPGSVVLVPDPGYPTYSLGTHLAGGVPERYPLLEENRYLPDLEAIPLDIARSAQVLWLNYPHNPTGATAPVEVFEQVVDFARRNDILVCHDNPYAEVTFGDHAAPSILQVPGAMEVALEFNSLSKSYNMAGWRVGMAVGNAAAVGALAKTKTIIDSGIFRPIQDAAIVALASDPGWLRERNEVYRRRRDLIIKGLGTAGIHAECPDAAMYIWAEVPQGYSSFEFSDRLLEEVGISVTPGPAFGALGEGYLRISLGCDTKRVGEAMQRLAQFGF